MIQFLKTPLQKSITIIGAIVDCYGLIQLFRDTNFKPSLLVNNSWFWLVVIVSLSVIGLLLYFREKERRHAKENEFSAYRKNVGTEFKRLYDLVEDLYEKNKEMNLKLADLKEKA